MTADGVEGYPSREDRIVAEFGDGFDVEGIAFRYGLSVAQVYAVVEREVEPAAQPPTGVLTPAGYPHAAPSLQPAPGLPAEDAIVAAYGQGHDVAWIARLHGLTVAQVYEVVRRAVADDSPPPAGLLPPT